MPSRGDITDKWHRACINCGNREHVNKVRREGECEKCGDDRWTRDTTKVEA